MTNTIIASTDTTVDGALYTPIMRLSVGGVERIVPMLTIAPQTKRASRRTRRALGLTERHGWSGRGQRR